MTEPKPVPDTRNVHQRLLDVMKEVTYVQKDRTIGNYKVVTHDAVTAKVRPSLVKHGVLYYPQNLRSEQDGNRTVVHMDIHFVNANDPQDRVAVPTFGYGIDAQDKGPGKSVSYAVKMALLKALGLETGEDADDGTNVEHVPAPKNAPGISKAKTWVSEFIRDGMACENGGAFMDLCKGTRTHWIKICGVYPNLYVGPDGSGLRGEAQRIATIMECRDEYDLFVQNVESSAVALKQPMAAE